MLCQQVKWWITFNEPLEVCESGYGVGTGAPGYGMSGTADYLCGHTLLKAHARAYNIYDKKYRFSQQGKFTSSKALFESFTGTPYHFYSFAQGKWEYR